jgi:hypothetical protein
VAANASIAQLVSNLRDAASTICFGNFTMLTSTKYAITGACQKADPRARAATGHAAVASLRSVIWLIELHPIPHEPGSRTAG